jgi:hypothetical protein
MKTLIIANNPTDIWIGNLPNTNHRYTNPLTELESEKDITTILTRRSFICDD